MDIEKELEKVIKKHRGKEVATFETRIDLLAQDCLDEIRRLKKQISDSALAEPEIKEAHYLAGLGEYHIWEEPDGANYIESMVDDSYVLIRADQLKNIIARQSVKSEEVAEAIEELRLGENAWGRGHVFAPTPYTVSLAIAALRQYQKPTESKENIL